MSEKKELPVPVTIVMRKTSELYPFLLKDGIYIIPQAYSDLLISREEADLALDIDVTSEPVIFGEKRFIASTKAAIPKSNKQKSLENAEEKKKTSLFIDEKYMYEQIKKVSGCAFIRYDFTTHELTEMPIIDSSEMPLYPIDDEEVSAGHIRLPNGITEYGTEEQLIVAIETHVRKYLDVPEDYLHYAALNVLKSWAYERYRSLNYLRVQGEPGSGKSRFLDVIGGLHYKPIATSGASTVAPIFRLINKWGCTLIMDEADLKVSDETNDLIKIINQGFEKDRPVIRCNPDNKSQVEFFNVYCPKVLSTRHAFEDVATESRCMTQIMTGTTRSDIVSSLNQTFYDEQQELRNKLLLWRFRNFQRLDPDIGEKLDWEGVEPRLKQVNVGFISLIYQDAEYTAKFMARIKAQQEALRSERSETYEGQIISACCRLILDNKPITANAVIDYAELIDTKGNKWKGRRLASYMKTLGFLGTKVLRVDNATIKEYEYNPEVLYSFIKRYVQKDELLNFQNEIRNKLETLKGSYHNHFISYYVTVVTIVYEQGNNGNKQEKRQNVTVGGSDHSNGNNGNNVTNNRLTKLLEDGDLIETEPGVYMRVD